MAQDTTTAACLKPIDNRVWDRRRGWVANLERHRSDTCYSLPNKKEVRWKHIVSLSSGVAVKQCLSYICEMLQQIFIMDIEHRWKEHSSIIINYVNKMPAKLKKVPGIALAKVE